MVDGVHCSITGRPDGGPAPTGGILTAVAEGKPRILQGNRDMLWSLIVLMAICAAFAGIAGLCSFSPTGPKDGPIPQFDADASLRQDARHLATPVRSPALPADWTSNSGRVQNLAGQDASHVGWVTPDRGYLELVQSLAPADAYRSLPGGPRPDKTSIPVRGHDWTVYSSDDDTVRPVWVLDLDGARVGLIGNAPRSDFETLAAAVQEAPPLPRK